MGLKAPGILTFMFSVVLVVVVIMVKLFAAQIPFVNGHEVWWMLAAHAIMVAGCTMRGF